MTGILLTATLVFIVTLLFYRAILRLLYYCAMFVVVVTAFRIVVTLLPELNHDGFWISSAVGGVLGFVVIGILCAGWIRQALIWFYLQDTIDRSKQAAAKGKLW